MNSPGYVFIVGSYRTGTDLLRNVLNASDEIAICGETHFFGNPRSVNSLIEYLLMRWTNSAAPARKGLLREFACEGSRQAFARAGNLATDAGARRIVEHIYGCKQSFWRWLQRHVERGEFERRLLASDRTERALLDLIMAFYANGKPIRGEKTPAHIYYVPTLLEWFPEAKIIHMFRDPRAIFASQKKKKSKTDGTSLRARLLRKTRFSYEIYLGLNIIVHWLRVVQLHKYYERQYPRNYLLCRFEDLVMQPEACLERLCGFLGIKPSAKMLERRVVNSSFVSSQQGVSGFDPSAIDRWRRVLHPATQKWFAWACRKHLVEFNYPT